jgi:hypothetical protein
MGKFDDLFDEFFNQKPKYSMEKFDNNFDNVFKSFDEAKDENLKRIIDMLSNFEDAEHPMESILKTGKLIKSEYYEEDGLFFNKETWLVNDDEIIKVMVSDIPFINESPEIELSLEEQLKISIENEDYENAASIRDAILKTKKV